MQALFANTAWSSWQYSSFSLFMQGLRNPLCYQIATHARVALRTINKTVTGPRRKDLDRGIGICDSPTTHRGPSEHLFKRTVWQSLSRDLKDIDCMRENPILRGGFVDFRHCNNRVLLPSVFPKVRMTEIHSRCLKHRNP